MYCRLSAPNYPFDIFKLFLCLDYILISLKKKYVNVSAVIYSYTDGLDCYYKINLTMFTSENTVGEYKEFEIWRK